MGETRKSIILLLWIIGSPVSGVYLSNKLHLTCREFTGGRRISIFRNYFAKSFYTSIVHNFDSNMSKYSGSGRDLLYYVYKCTVITTLLAKDKDETLNNFCCRIVKIQSIYHNIDFIVWSCVRVEIHFVSCSCQPQCSIFFRFSGWKSVNSSRLKNS